MKIKGLLFLRKKTLNALENMIPNTNTIKQVLGSMVLKFWYVIKLNAKKIKRYAQCKYGESAYKLKLKILKTIKVFYKVTLKSRKLVKLKRIVKFKLKKILKDSILANKNIKKLLTNIKRINLHRKIRNKSVVSILQLLMVFVVFIAGMSFARGYINLVNENKKLIYENNNQKDEINKLGSSLNNLSQEVNGLKEKEEYLNKTVIDFKNKYKELTDKYISTRGNPIANRGGTRVDASFLRDIKDLKSIINIVNEKAGKNNKVDEDIKLIDTKLKKKLDSFPTLWPVNGNITSGYGSRFHPTSHINRFHDGIDIAAPTGTPIKASANGVVVLAGWHGGYGNAVIIEHGRGLSTLYGHASSIHVVKGQTVKKGEVIAGVGTTGVSTGAHVHFEVRVDGGHVNPINYLCER